MRVGRDGWRHILSTLIGWHLLTLGALAGHATPDRISGASPVHDVPAPGPSVIASGSIDGASLRERIVARLKRDRGPVTVLRGHSARSLGKRLCEAVVPRVPADTPILLKPNIGGFAWFRNPARHGGDNGVRGRTTDPEFVRGVIRCLTARGHRKITVAEGWSARHRDWKRLIAVSGYAAMTREEGVPLVAMNDDGVFDVDGEQPGKPLAIRGMEQTSVPTLLMPKILAEHLDRGLVISLPKLKTHRFSVISMGLKGLQGTVMYADAAPAHRQKWRTHRELGPYLAARKKGLAEDRAAYVAALESFAERMADILEVEAPHVVLAEGAPAMSGDGFRVLVPSAENIAIGGTNPVLVDRVGAQLLGLWNNADLARELGGHATSPLIEVAARRLGLDLSKVTVVGNGAGLLQTPRPVHFVAMAPFTIESAGTSASRSTGGAGASASASASTSREAAADAGGKPVARAASLGTATITVDGKGEDPAWRAAPVVAWQTDYAGANTGITTRARFLWSRGALYALFELEGAGLRGNPERPIEVEHDRLYQEDCVELFLVPDPARLRHYYEIELGPYGHWFDLEVDLDGKLKRAPGAKRATRRRNLAWSSGLQVATTRDAAARTATIEVAITAPAIRKLLIPGARLPMGLYRIEGQTPRRYLAWSPPRTPRPKFHVPEAFGVLVLQ